MSTETTKWNTSKLFRYGAMFGGLYAVLAPNYAWFHDSRLAQWLDIGGIFGRAAYSFVSVRYLAFGFGFDSELHYASGLIGGALMGGILFGSLSGLRNLFSEN